VKYLIIDGNNLAIRCAFANQELKNTEGISTGVHFGFFQSLISLKQKFGNYKFLIAWDGKSARRVEEANKAVALGIIPDGYKENRKKDEIPVPLQDFYDQAPYLQRAIGQTGIPQIRLSNFEADDVIYSYCHKLKQDKENDIIVVTSDSDYIQLLDDNVRLWDGMKQAETTKDSWEKENGVVVGQYVEIGALCGDDSDNIYNAPGWGEATALKAIQTYKTHNDTIEAYRAKYAPFRVKYPDLTQEEADVKKLETLVTLKTKAGKVKYPFIKWNSPYAGVLLAMEEGVKGIVKNEVILLMFEERVKLAHSLKKMDIVPDLPEIVSGEFNKEKLLEYFGYYGINSLRATIDLLKE
jgi:5'-3' exonuclease